MHAHTHKKASCHSSFIHAQHVHISLSLLVSAALHTHTHTHTPRGPLCELLPLLLPRLGADVDQVRFAKRFSVFASVYSQ